LRRTFSEYNVDWRGGCETKHPVRFRTDALMCFSTIVSPPVLTDETANKKAMDLDQVLQSLNTVAGAPARSGKRRVTWAPDSKLCSIRLFQPDIDDEPVLYFDFIFIIVASTSIYKCT
jgi:hypothetical protein